MYIPSDYIKEYFNKHKEFSLTEDEINKCVEVLSALVLIQSSPEKADYEGFIRPPTSSLETQECRKSICKRCPEYDKKNDGCNLCGCIVDHKVVDPGTKCPMDRWSIDSNFFKNEIVKIISFVDTNLKRSEINGTLVHRTEFESIRNRDLMAEEE